MPAILESLKKRAPKAVLFYLLGTYVLLQFCWWAYMLVNLNSEIYQLKLELLQQSGLAAPEMMIQKADLDQKLTLRIWMVLGEGAVFVSILLMGFWAVRRSIVKELHLAEQQKNFLLSVTHELKSPLAAVKLQLQTLLTRELPEEKRKMLYARALSDSDRLEKLVENLLLVNKVESGKLPLAKEKLELSEFVRWLLNNYYPDETSSLRIQMVSSGVNHIVADRMALQSILINLIDNGIKYGAASPVIVSVNGNANEVILQVADTGSGIPDLEKDKVFERFYRRGNEEVRQTKGTGIGLYLVKMLVQGHCGSIDISDNKPSGAIFTVTLPMAGV
ncbi:MAG: hypothetical protein RL266_10 [Bacteroidota bacterium]|jgi:signal transduction histidine kinase